MKHRPVGIDIFDLNTQSVSIKKLKEKLTELENKYGTNSILHFDAGYNNVEVEIFPSKSPRSKV
jgi:hypothetical protein